MSHKVKILSPFPKKTSHQLLKTFAIKAHEFTKSGLASTSIKELDAMRGNSQNPHDKDEIFKFQCVEDVDEKNEAWDKFDVDFGDICRFEVESK